jgi:hypothetical protein
MANSSSRKSKNNKKHSIHAETAHTTIIETTENQIETPVNVGQFGSACSATCIELRTMLSTLKMKTIWA